MAGPHFVFGAFGDSPGHCEVSSRRIVSSRYPVEPHPPQLSLPLARHSWMSMSSADTPRLRSIRVRSANWLPPAMWRDGARNLGRTTRREKEAPAGWSLPGDLDDALWRLRWSDNGSRWFVRTLNGVERGRQALAPAGGIGDDHRTAAVSFRTRQSARRLHLGITVETAHEIDTNHPADQVEARHYHQHGTPLPTAIHHPSRV